MILTISTISHGKQHLMLICSFSFWAPGEPNGQTKDVPDEDCVVTVAVPQLPDWPGLEGWLDVKCDRGFKWICEKQISQFILP